MLGAAAVVLREPNHAASAANAAHGVVDAVCEGVGCGGGGDVGGANDTSIASTKRKKNLSHTEKRPKS